MNVTCTIPCFSMQIGSTPKWASFVTMGFYKAPSDVQFVKMKGPGGKGYAEMAVERYNTKLDEEVSEIFHHV